MKARKKKRSIKPITKKKVAKAEVAKSKIAKPSVAKKKKPSIKGREPLIGICAVMGSSKGGSVHDAFVSVFLPVTPLIYKPIEKLFGLDWKKEFTSARAFALQKPNARMSELDYWAPLFIMGVGREDRRTFTHVYALKWGDAVFVFGSGIYVGRKRIVVQFAKIVGKKGEVYEEVEEEDGDPVNNVSLTLGVEAVRAIKSAAREWNKLFEHKMIEGSMECEELNLKGEKSVVLKTFDRVDVDEEVWTKNWDDSDCLNAISDHWPLQFVPGYCFP